MTRKIIGLVLTMALLTQLIAIPTVRAQSNAAPSAPSGLLTNELEYPLNVEVPTFGWLVNDTDENEIQTAYQIIVTDEITDKEFWDSGKVESSVQSYVEYGGEPLEAAHPYSWKVRTWDKDGAESPYSEDAHFATGLCDMTEWDAVWISDGTTGAEKSEGTHNHFWYARKSDTLDSSKTVKKAYAYISGLQDYDLYVNGTEIGRGQSFDYASESRYQGWDITDAVMGSDSSVTVGALIRTYGGGQGRAAVNAGLLGHIKIYYTDGTEQSITTDKTWHVSQTVPISGTAKRNGEGDFVENYDARNEQAEFSQSSFNASAWDFASDRVVDEEIISPTAELSKPTSYEVTPESITVLPDGTTIADFGKVIPARPMIVFKNGSAGRSITIQTGYALNEDGSLNMSDISRQNTDMRYIYTQKDGEQIYNAWDHLGFRYISIPDCGEVFDENTVKAKVVHTNVPDGRDSTFKSSNETLNNVYDLMKRSALYGIQNEFVDTPTREKGQFTDDSRNISEAAMAAWFEREASRKAINQFLASADRYWTDDSGELLGRYNSVYPNVDGKRDIPEYSINMPQWIWNYYMQTGDKATLEKAYPYMRATAVNYIAKYIPASGEANEGLVTKIDGGWKSYDSDGVGHTRTDYTYGIIDWPKSGRFDYGLSWGAMTTVNMLSKHAFDVVALAAAELEKDDDAELMHGYSDDLKAAINTKLQNSSGLYVDSTGETGGQGTHTSQHANSYALAFDVVTEENITAAADFVSSQGMKQGPMTADILVKGLFRAGKSSAALKLLTEPNDYGWANILEQGGTFTWESWAADGSSINDSQSHSWGSTAASDILENFAGAQIIKAGAEEIKIAPAYTDLSSLDTSVWTERGAVKVSYERNDEKFDITVTVPANVTAQIELPVIGNGEFKRTNGDAQSEKDDEVQIFSVGSGTYIFSYEGDITVLPEEVVYNKLYHTGIAGTADTENNIYTWEIGNADTASSAGEAYADKDNGYVDLTVSLGKSDSMAGGKGIKFAASSVGDKGSVGDTKRYILVRPEYDGVFGMDIAFSEAASNKKNRIYYCDLGSDTENIDLTEFTKPNGDGMSGDRKIQTAGNDITTTDKYARTIAMTAGHTYMIYTYQKACTISALSYEYKEIPTEPVTKPFKITNREINGNTAHYSLYADADDGSSLIAAVYGNDGGLYSIDTADIKDKTADVSVEIPDKTSEVKFMIWNSMSGMKPLYDAITIQAGVYEEGTEEKQRVIVLTDISSIEGGVGEPDDTESLIRFLLYSNTFDIEGLIATYTNYDKTSHPELIKEIVGKYGQVRDNLIKHDYRYPAEEELLSVIKQGNTKCGIEQVGEGKDTEGSEWIISVVDKEDSRPVWITVWGAPTDLAQAIWKVTNTRSEEEAAAFKSKIRVYSILDQYDTTGQWIKENYPDITYLTSYLSFRGMYRGGEETLSSEAWVRENVVENHGVLGAAYPVYDGGDNIGTVKGMKEGDTPSFLYLIQNGLNDCEHPTYGGWGGRFEQDGNQYTDAQDTYGGETSERASVFRWRSDYQNDFAARMDWCVKDYSEANHAPIPVIDTDSEFTVDAGDTVKLSAENSYDPDDDSLNFSWTVYWETGDFDGEISMTGAKRANMSFTAPEVYETQTVHIILSVTDNGSPTLTRYKRIIVHINPVETDEVTQADLNKVYNELQTPYKYGMVVTSTGDEGTVDVDCQGVFRYGDKWYMTYVSYDSSADIGYRTHLASSDNLTDWTCEGCVFEHSEDYPQCAAFPALQDTEWGGTNELETAGGKYWWTTMEGTVRGYEGQPMSIGLLSTTDPSNPEGWVHENQAVLSVNDDDVRDGETGTLYKSNVIHDPDKTLGYEYVMYYNATNPSSTNWRERIFMAVSDDMENWQRYGDSYVLYVEGHTITGDPQVVKMGNLWVMNIFTYPGKTPAYDTFAVSKDLVNWTLWNGEPTVSASELYDNKHAHKPWIIKHDGVVYHFYCARSTDGSPRGIALATSVDLKAERALSDTAISVKGDAENVAAIYKTTLGIYKGATAAQIKNEIESVLGGEQSYEITSGGETVDDEAAVSENSTFIVTSPDGSTRAEYNIKYATVWDFSEYADEVSTTEDGFTESYNGLTIAIAANGADSDHDKISADGVYWRGGTSSGKSTRYIAYIPETDGVFVACGRTHRSGGRWGISNSLDVSSMSASSSSASTAVSAVTAECSAGSTYYIINKARAASVSKIAYVSE